MKNKKYVVDLQLFAESGGDGAVVGTGENNADAGQESAFCDSEKEFSQLINGKFKEQFSKKTQEIIDKRFKRSKELEEYKDKVGATISSVLEICGLAEGEEDKIPQILKNMTVLQENENSNKNEDNDAEKAVNRFETRKSEDENSPNPERNINRFRPRALNLARQMDETKKLYPDFDIRREMKSSPTFSRLVCGGVDLKTAYETVHRDRILTDAMAYTAQKVKEKVVENIRAKGMRPLENGVVSQNAVVSAVDVNALTSNDILKILKQVENGKSVSFGHR